MFFHRPSITSTYDSAESIATLPPESDLDDEQIRALLVSPLSLQGREASADRSQVHFSVRENLVSCSSQVPKSIGKSRRVAFKRKDIESRNIFRQRRFFLRTSTGSMKQRTSIQISTPENSTKSFLEGHSDSMLAEAKSEGRRHESRADYLDSSVRDLQRQLDSNCLEIYCTNEGYEESRKEQARLHEELAQRKRVLRETQIRSIYEVGELKRAQEMRIDEFSRNELRESHATIQELTSQIQELQERMINMNDSREFQDVESIYSGKVSHVPSQPAVVPSPRSMLSHRETFFGHPRGVIDSSQTLYQGILHSTSQSAAGEKHRAEEYRETCCER